MTVTVTVTVTQVKIQTAGAAPAPTTLALIKAQGFEVLHTYGLTEVSGPGVVCCWKSEWDHLDEDTQVFMHVFIHIYVYVYLSD